MNFVNEENFMKHADVLNEVILNLQAYDLSHVEETIMRLNVRIANLPAEVRVRFEPCSKCGIILTPGRKLAKHARDCIFPALRWKRKEVKKTECLSPDECGMAWLDPEVGYISDLCENCQEKQEDEDYARQCADEKWRSNHS